jgi:hypothetical protein
MIPSTVTFGALMASAATGSAILFHLAKLGITLKPVGDHGELFRVGCIGHALFDGHTSAAPPGVAAGRQELQDNVTELLRHRSSRLGR